MRNYFRSLLVAINRLGGALFFGEPDMTISTQAYVATISVYNTISWKTRVLRVLARVLDFFSPGHCRRSGLHAKVRAKEVLDHLPIY